MCFFSPAGVGVVEKSMGFPAANRNVWRQKIRPGKRQMIIQSPAVRDKACQVLTRNGNSRCGWCGGRPWRLVKQVTTRGAGLGATDGLERLAHVESKPGRVLIGITTVNA